MSKIKITLRKDGTQKVEVVDGAGPDCVEKTRPFEDRLGVAAGKREQKPEFNTTVSVSVPEKETAS